MAEPEGRRTDREMKRGEATRRLNRAGLRPEAARRRPIAAAGGAACVVVILVYLFGNDASLTVVGGTYIVFTLLWAVVPGWRDWLGL